MKMNHKKQHGKRWALGALAIVLALANGCTTRHSDFSAFIREPRPLVTATEYLIAPPDVIRITSKRIREINGHSAWW